MPLSRSERGYLVRTLASRPGVPGWNSIASPKSYEVYPSTSGLLSFKKPETVLWTIAKHYYYCYWFCEISISMFYILHICSYQNYLVCYILHMVLEYMKKPI